MNAFRNHHSLRIVAVVVTLCGWFVLSNHCALTRMALGVGAKKETKAHECCDHGTSHPTKQPMEGKDGVQCCKSLRALLPADAKLPVVSSVVVFTLPSDYTLLTVALPDLSPAAPATGPPPRAVSFSELVLHRSLRSHAPPLFA